MKKNVDSAPVAFSNSQNGSNPIAVKLMAPCTIETKKPRRQTHPGVAIVIRNQLESDGYEIQLSIVPRTVAEAQDRVLEGFVNDIVFVCLQHM